MTVLVFKTSSQNCAANSQSDLIELGSVSMLSKKQNKKQNVRLAVGLGQSWRRYVGDKCWGSEVGYD
jgi:hypothetical protein